MVDGPPLFAIRKKLLPIFKKNGRSLVLYGASDDITDELKKTVLLLRTGDWEKGIKKF